MITLCGDDELGYERSRTRFTAGLGLAFDDAYRLAHLPLVAPDHPLVIARTGRDGLPYAMGRHDRVFSLVMPVAHAVLASSAAYRTLDAELHAAPFAAKIAWHAAERRQDKLHATICGALSTGRPPTITPEARRALAAIGPLTVELRGLFSGNVNVGRLYVRVYPERRDGANTLHRVQRALARRETDLYVVGLHNFVEPLDAGEAAALAALLERWWHVPLARLTVAHLVLLGADDDLALASAVVERLPLA
jgi:hypothetical protein